MNSIHELAYYLNKYQFKNLFLAITDHLIYKYN